MGWQIKALSWVPSAWIFGPIRLFAIPAHGADFWISAKFDQTTVVRVIVNFVLSSLLSPAILVAGEFYLQTGSGTGNDACVGRLLCKQGFNFVDLAGSLLGVLLWRVVFALPSLDLVILVRDHVFQ